VEVGKKVILYQSAKGAAVEINTDFLTSFLNLGHNLFGNHYPHFCVCVF
jgi:hypothetical protein